MRNGPNQRRSRGRGNNNQGNGPQRRPSLPNRNQSFDSNGPDVRIRGTAFQVSEKYQALARDAAAAGDRVLAENHLQHAEHYTRIINAWNESAEEQRSVRDQRPTNAEARANGAGGEPSSDGAPESRPDPVQDRFTDLSSGTDGDVEDLGAPPAVETEAAGEGATNGARANGAGPVNGAADATAAPDGEGSPAPCQRRRSTRRRSQGATAGSTEPASADGPAE